MSFRVSKRRSSATLQLDESTKVQTMRRVSSLEPLEDMVKCPIDLNFLEDPRLLPCGHAFCCECLTRYMHQVAATPSNKSDPAGKVELFCCPICRATCAIPTTLNANSFPKAFNHTAILDFLRKARLSDLRVRATAPTNNSKCVTEDTLPDQPYRKTSIQVSSQMLNYIVNDIASYEKVGKIGEVDKRVILDDVNKLLQRLELSSVPAPNAVVPSAPPRECSTPSPTGSARNLGRFHTFGNRRRSSRSSSGAETYSNTLSYTTYRDVETARLNMKHNAAYHVLAKGKDCCIMRPGEEHQPVDMQIVRTANTSTVIRCTLTTNQERSDLVLWRQQINIERDNFLFEKRKNTKTLEKLVQTQGPLKVDLPGKLKVQYVRFHGSLIYITCMIQPTVSEDGTPTYPLTTGHSDCGLLVCCSAIGLNATDCSSDSPEQSSDGSGDNFPIIATSCPFERDSVGKERLEHPILFGIDIDQQTGDIYVAQPANSMVCRISAQNLKTVSNSWYMNEPRLSPYFLCYAHSSVWTTCPQDDKIAILDLETDGFNHFSPSISFGITPSHIVHTTDERIVLLDQKQSRLYWIAKVHTTICVQSLDVQFNNRLQRHFLSIQPVDDAVTHVVSNASRLKSNLLGGILCAHDHGCSLIYPKREVDRSKSIKVSCLGLCIP